MESTFVLNNTKCNVFFFVVIQPASDLTLVAHMVIIAQASWLPGTVMVVMLPFILFLSSTGVYRIDRESPISRG